MKGTRLLSALLTAGAIVLVAGASTAAPKNYVFTGKLTSNRGILINIPVVGDTLRGCRPLQPADHVRTGPHGCRHVDAAESDPDDAQVLAVRVW